MESFNAVNDEVLSELRKQVENQIEIIKTDREYRIKDIENNIESLKVLYKHAVESRIAFLKEQSQLARALGIERNSIDAPSMPASPESLTAIERDITVYLRGYKAIEKEIELIRARTNEELFIPGIAELRMKIDEIQRDSSLERINLAIERSPLGQNSDFTAVNYDLNKIKITPAVKAPLVMALGLMLGLMLGVLALGLKNALASRAQA